MNRNLEDVDLINNIKKQIDVEESLEELVNRHSGIYLEMVNSYASPNNPFIDYEELIQDKEYKIYNAAMKYDPDRGRYQFIITDFKQEINVKYTGLKPNLFVEGQGAVVEGRLKTRTSLEAETILAKHDENYMPKEVADALKKSGDWNKKYGK